MSQKRKEWDGRQGWSYTKGIVVKGRTGELGNSTINKIPLCVTDMGKNYVHIRHVTNTEAMYKVTGFAMKYYIAQYIFWFSNN